MRLDALSLDPVVAYALRDAGRAVYVVTEGGWIVRETAERVGSLRLVRSRHVEHACPSTPSAPAAEYQQLEIVDLASVRPPARQNGGQLW